ncbi:transcriptional regulator, TetR family [Natronincola peptidivorans]|uniref:Transcriptional regulator, TetR family n=1 Tax=Natronincola peptidivorans TaxID=426128 RepID=A0A1I0DPG9_9FIRM|nr:TetR/AcrR family transcriptional regulator [Natronincola peptidivorans]SET34443.1 transcriptional regulator, TetR family [Natronincola peptidivorans]
MQVLKDEIRSRIIEAATEEFLAFGFQLTSTRKIISKAKISKGNLYNYFNSKEELFYTITSPVYDYLNSTMEKTFDHGETEKFNPIAIHTLAVTLGEMLSHYQKQFIILMTKSEGTKYANFKDQLIDKLSEHFLNSNRSSNNNEELDLLMKIVAANFIGALIEIAKEYKDREWAMNNVELYFKYHFNGIQQFF